MRRARAPSRTRSPRRGSRRPACGRRSGCGGRRSWPRFRAPAPPALVWKPRASMATTSASRSVSPAGRSRRGGVCPAASTTAVTASASSRPASRLLGERLRSLLGGSAAVRPRLGHRVIGVGGGQQPGREAELGAARPAVIARPVEALVMGAGDRRERREERASATGRARCGTGEAAPAPTRRQSAARASARSPDGPPRGRGRADARPAGSPSRCRRRSGSAPRPRRPARRHRPSGR